MAKKYENIIVEKEGAIGRLILNRPEKMNAMSPGLLQEFADACFDFRDDPNIHVFIIKGSGRTFCAGYDISGANLDPNKQPEAIEWYSRDPYPDDLFMRALWDNPKIIIAQVHGFCLAGAGNMVCHCDILYAADDALFGYPPARFASPGVHQLWPSLVGMRKAMEHLTTGNMLSAQTALRIGFANEIFPQDKLEEAVERLARNIAKVPYVGAMLNKRAVHEWYEVQGLRTALRYSQRLRDISYGSAAETISHGKKDMNIVTCTKGLKAGLEYMNGAFLEEDDIARGKMRRPDRK